MPDLQTYIEQQFHLRGRIAGLRAAARLARKHGDQPIARMLEREARKLEKEVRRG